MSGLDAEEKKLREIENEYRKKQKIAQTITDPQASASYRRDAAEVMARQRNAILTKQAKDRAESQIKFDKMIFDAEQKLADKAEAREKQTEQERVQRKIDNNNRIYREEAYNLGEKIKMETDADDRAFQRLVRDAYRAREEQKKAQQTATDVSGGLLGVTKGGQQALDTERKKRAIQVKNEDFKTQEAFFNNMAGAENLKREKAGLPLVTAQSMREKVAAQQVAGEMPSLSERIQGGLTGVDPSELARMGAVSKFEKDRSFPKGGATQTATGHLGYEKSSLSEETLQAIMKLVDIMKSGTVVQ
jgi:hypothetical protein